MNRAIQNRPPSQSRLDEIDADGFSILPAVFSPDEVESIAATLAESLARAGSSILDRQGIIYAARNLLEVWPLAASIWRRPPLDDLLAQVLGRRLGLVRALFFDKPPQQTWSLPWHKDLTIAVRDNHLPTTHFCKPTTKAGVPHVEASREVLENMLTARIHLDDVDIANGPIQVMPGSHRGGKTVQYEPSMVRTLTAKRGDVLLVRPLVAHCSLPSAAATSRHRRVLHLEFASAPELPDGYAWHDYKNG